MEKIKRAIEASKKNKKSHHETEKLPQQIIPHEVINQKELSESDNTNIQYEQTKVLSLNYDRMAKNRIVALNKNNHLSITFDILRTQIIEKMAKNNWRTIAITSPVPECGKTMVSINLAMSIAHQTNRTAMLVDFDLRRPSISKYLGLPSNTSLNDVLAGEATIEDSLVNPGLERLVILPTERPVKNSSEVLSSRKVSNLVTELRERYVERIVIFDLPPLLGSDDAMIMMSQVDCVLVVVGNGMVSKAELTESMRYVDSGKLLGTVLNKSNSEQSNRGYYY